MIIKHVKEKTHQNVMLIWGLAYSIYSTQTDGYLDLLNTDINDDACLNTKYICGVSQQMGCKSTKPHDGKTAATLVLYLRSADRSDLKFSPSNYSYIQSADMRCRFMRIRICYYIGTIVSGNRNHQDNSSQCLHHIKSTKCCLWRHYGQQTC